MKRNYVLLLAALLTIGILAGATFAAVPLLLSHQGRLLDSGNQPITGTRDITFHIYGDSTGGLPLWTESHLAVPIANGLFHVTLGGTATISADLLANTGPGVFNPTKWMVLQIAGTELLPRMRLGSVPYAVMSSRVSGDVETLPGELSLSGMSGSTTATIRASENPGNPGSELSLVDGSSGPTVSMLALQPLGGEILVHSRMSGSTTGTIRMQATVDSAVTNVGLDLDGDDIPDVGTTSEAKVSRNILKSFFQTGDFPTQARFRTQNGSSSMDLSCLEIDQEHTASVSADSTGSELKFKNGPIGGGMSGSTTGTIRVGHTEFEGGGAGLNDFTVTGTFTDGSTRDVTCDMSASLIGSMVNLVDDRNLLGLRSVSASSDSAAGTVLLEADLDGDGVMERNVWQKVDNTVASVSTSSRFASGPRQTTSMDGSFSSAQTLVATDMEDNGIPDIGFSSRTSADSVVQKSFFERGDKPTQSQFSNTIDSYGVRSLFSSRNGSTTGTIRMMASPDSVDEISTTSDGSSSSTSSMRLRTDNLESILKNFGLLTSTAITQTCDSTGSSFRAINTKGTGAVVRTTMSANDSAGVSFDSDADGDGHQERNVGIYVGEVSGQSKMECLADTDDDGVADMTAETVVDATSASSRWKGMSGSTTGTIRMRATADSSILDLGYSGSTTATIRLQASSSSSANPIEHSSGAHLTPGGDWTNASDKNLKENFTKVNGEELLEKIEDLPITEWNYKNEGESVKHIGPTAQDFQSAFGVGSDDKSISTVDPSGIALAAIKELIKQNQDLMKANEELNKRVKALEKKQEKN